MSRYEDDKVTMWEAMDLNGDVFLYPIEPVWSHHTQGWTLPYVDDTLCSTVRMQKPTKGLRVDSKPIKHILPKEEYLRLLQLYRS